MPSRRSVNKKLVPPPEESDVSDIESPPPSESPLKGVEEDSESDEETSDVEYPVSGRMKQKEQDSDSDSGSDSDEVEDRDDPTVELNDGIINITYFDSSDEESDGFDEEEPEPDLEFDDDGEEVDSSNIDDETEEKFSILTERLEEVAYVIYTGRNSFRINFQNKKGIKLVPKKEKCDFDIDDDGLPIMMDGGENYILPYLVELCKRRSDLKPFQITTNCSKRRYNF
ncbi:MAG: hypothetical protein S4CHLAM20_14700 [Chlamydiia bacterium]|nr:hypothetical protein [Chlamydiia bacterium]